jgi:hypothetical protein
MTVRDRRVIAVVVSLLVLVAAWLLVIEPKRSQASRLGAQITAAQRQLTTATAQVASETADERAYPQNYASDARLGEAVPTNDDTGSLIYQLQTAAQKAGVDFNSLVLDPASGTAAPTTTSTSTTSTSTTSKASASASASAASSETLPPGVTVGPAGFPVMPFTFTFNGDFFKLADFLGRLQRFVIVTNKQIQVSGRLMTLNAISLAPGTGGFPQISATISATTYLEAASSSLAPSQTSTPSTSTEASTSATSKATSTSAATPAVITPPTP